MESAHGKWSKGTESWPADFSIEVQLPNEPTYPEAVDWSAYARSFKPFLSQQSDFPGMTYFGELTFTELKRNKGHYTVCQKVLCCHLTYKMSEK